MRIRDFFRRGKNGIRPESQVPSAIAPDQYAAHHPLVHSRDDTRFHRKALSRELGNKGLCLEIGPYFHPVVTGENARYFDVFNTEELRRNAAADPDPYVTADTIPEMHYSDKNADLSVIPERFAEAFSSHCIEHQPDFIAHLEQVHDLLDPGGRYVVLVPDKRFCFNHFVPPSTVGDVLQAHLEKRTRHTLAAVIDHFAGSTHNDPKRHWEGDHADEGYWSGYAARLQHALEIYEAADGDYIDLHAWYFIPDSFAHICETLHETGKIRLKLECVGDTRVHGLEFSAIFRREPA